MQEKFCIDTSVFITAYQQYYAFDLFPSFWRSLERWGKQGKWISCAAVFDELTNGKSDALSNWAKANATLFLQPGLAVSAKYQEIAELVIKRYEPHHAETFLASADPWVVAQAAASGQIVVTLEAERQEYIDPRTERVHGHVKLPNVCRHFGVEFINTFAMLRRLGFKC